MKTPQAYDKPSCMGVILQNQDQPWKEDDRPSLFALVDPFVLSYQYSLTYSTT